jgi:hypothetical protein
LSLKDVFEVLIGENKQWQETTFVMLIVVVQWTHFDQRKTLIPKGTCYIVHFLILTCIRLFRNSITFALYKGLSLKCIKVPDSLCPSASGSTLLTCSTSTFAYCPCFMRRIHSMLGGGGDYSSLLLTFCLTYSDSMAGAGRAYNWLLLTFSVACTIERIDHHGMVEVT